MTEPDLPELLERAGERVYVGPPPVEQMIADASRWRRALMVAAGAAAAVSTIAVTAMAVLPGGVEDPPPLVASPGTVETPPGTRLVGLEHAAIAVPEEWRTNDTRCATPQTDTVIIDVAVIPLCLTKYPQDVESVELTHGGPRLDFHADTTIEIDGMTAQRQDTTCSDGIPDDFTVCSGTVYLPSLEVSFRAESSTSAGDVDQILERIQMVPGRVGVPGFQTIALDAQDRAKEAYIDALTEAGLDAEIQTKKDPGTPPGYLLDVSPAPGTMVQPGDKVTITVAAT